MNNGPAMTAKIDLASPAQLESPLLAGPATLQWDETKIDVGMGMSGPQSVSFDADNFSAELAFPELAGAKAAANDLRAWRYRTLTPTERLLVQGFLPLEIRIISLQR